MLETTAIDPHRRTSGTEGAASERLMHLLHEQAETPSSFNEHVYTLCDYARRSRSVCEMGVAQGTSTAGLVAGLYRNGAEEKRLLCIDMDDCSQVPALLLASELGIDAQFKRSNSAAIDIPAVDLLFIDTWHCYGHLRRELARHHGQVRSWIILHDTAIDGYRGESVRMGHDLIEMAKISGYSIDEIYRGLGFAIEEFLSEHQEWQVERIFSHNNGLTILRRQH